MRPTVRVQVEVKPTLSVRRPPRQLLELLDKPEDEFRQYVTRVEGSTVFRQLLDSGAIRRVKTRGRVPREKYEEYMDVQLMQFLRQYVLRHEQWEDDFRDPDALERVEELATRYRAPAAKLRKMIDYFQRVTSPHYGTESYGGGSSTGGGEALGYESDGPDYVELIPSRADVDAADSIVLIREFVEAYRVEEGAFRRDFMLGEVEAEILAERYQAPLADVVEVLDAIGRVHIQESFIGSASQAVARNGLAGQAGDGQSPVARVMLTDEGRCVAIQFEDEGVYAERYRTSPDAVARLADLNDSDAAETLLLELQWINQRKTLLCRLVMAVCRYQYRYFLTGDLSALKPLSQADIARELGEDEATVCRLLRDKYIDSPYGLMEVRFLFQKKTDVVRRIVERNPDLTDNQIRAVLERDYNTTISRRTVAYHRLKFQRDEEPAGEPGRGDAAAD